MSHVTVRVVACTQISVRALAAAIVLVCLVAFLPVAYAQEGDVPPDATAVAAPADDGAAAAEALDAAVDAVIAAEEPTEAAAAAIAADTDVHPEDLGVADARVLPDSRWYAFKRGGRWVRKAMTRDPEKREALELRYANQGFADAQKLAETKGAEAFEAIAATVASAREELGAIAARSGERELRTGENGVEANAFLDTVAGYSFKQQKVLDAIAEHVNAEAVGEARERYTAWADDERIRVLEHVGEVVGAGSDPAELSARLERALESQEGSEFKSFKNIQVLQELGQRLPEGARGAVVAAEERATERLASKLQGNDGAAERFAEVVAHMPGQAVRQFEVLDRVRSKADLPQELVAKVDAMKAKAVEKFNRDVAQAGTGARERLLERFEGGDAGAVRVAEQFKHFVPEEVRAEIEAREDASVEQFKEHFKGATVTTGEAVEVVADEAQRLMRKVRENPEPTDFIILQKLQEKLTPEQRAFVDALEREGAEQFDAQFKAGGEAFLERFADPNVPQAAGVLELLREQGVPGEGLKRAIAVQRARFQEHLDDLERPEVLGHIKDAIERDPELKAQFEAGDPEVFRKIGAREETLRRRIEGERQRMREAILEEDVEAHGGEALSPEEREEIKRGREMFQKIQESRGVAPGPFRMPFPPPGEEIPGVLDMNEFRTFFGEGDAVREGREQPSRAVQPGGAEHGARNADVEREFRESGRTLEQFINAPDLGVPESFSDEARRAVEAGRARRGGGEGDAVRPVVVPGAPSEGGRDGFPFGQPMPIPPVKVPGGVPMRAGDAGEPPRAMDLPRVQPGGNPERMGEPREELRRDIREQVREQFLERREEMRDVREERREEMSRPPVAPPTPENPPAPPQPVETPLGVLTRPFATFAALLP